MRSLTAMMQIAIRRMLKQGGLTLLALLGVIFAIAFCTAIPLYTNTIFNRLLQTELYDKRRSMPAFALLFRYKGDTEKVLAWDDVQPVSDYLAYHTAPALGLPLDLIVRYIVSPEFDIFHPDETSFEKRFAISRLSFGTQSDFEDHITLSDVITAPPNSNTLDVLISEQLLFSQDWTIGQTFLALREEQTPSGQQAHKMPFRISGIWRKTDPQEAYWFYNPAGLLEDVLLLTETAYAQQFAPIVEDDIANAMWYLILDGDTFRPNQADGFLRRLDAVPIRAGSLLPNIELMVAPAAGALREFQSAARWLTVALFAFSVPVLGIIVIFLGMVVRLIVEHQRTEIAILRSRGASEEQTLGIAALQGLMIGGVALAAGIPAGRQFAMLMARSRGFLDYSGVMEMQLLVTPTNLQIGLGVVCGLVLSLLFSTFGLLQNTIVLHHQDVGRTNQKPWWQKVGLDLILLAAALYGVFQLRYQDAMTSMGEGSATEIIQQNPLLFLVPALCSLSLALLALRILPIISAFIAGGFAQTNRVAPLLAVRQVARHPKSYTAPIMLLVLTLSLAVFTSSLALTLQRYEDTLAYHEIGADVQLFEVGENTEVEIDVEVEKLCLEDPELPCPWENPTAAEAWIEEMGLRDRPRWRFMPISEHLQVPGVRAASPVGQYTAEALSREIGAEGVYMGIDRSSFINVAYWERHFAVENLGTLMNALAIAPEGVLVSRDMMDQLSLVIGDTMPVKVVIAEPGKVGEYQEVNLILKVVGSFDRFPTWTPDQGPLFVGNLDYLFQEAGGQFPYQVWLKTNTDSDPAVIVKAVKALGYNVQSWKAPSLRVDRAMTRPEFQGLMGMLSTGFLISACLTILGLLLYVFFSFRRRSIEVGMLRAIGLSKTQVTGLMIWELAFLMLLGSLGGTVIGLGVSRVLIPSMRVGMTIIPQEITPVVVTIAWNHIFLIYGLFVFLFVLMILILITALNRVQLYAVLKLGDTM